MKTLSELRKQLQSLENQGYGNLPLIYSRDDEGNSYHHVIKDACLTQVHNMNDYYLEVVGFYDEDSDDIQIDDVNCVIIN